MYINSQVTVDYHRGFDLFRDLISSPISHHSDRSAIAAHNHTPVKRDG